MQCDCYDLVTKNFDRLTKNLVPRNYLICKQFFFLVQRLTCVNSTQFLVAIKCFRPYFFIQSIVTLKCVLKNHRRWQLGLEKFQSLHIHYFHLSQKIDIQIFHKITSTKMNIKEISQHFRCKNFIVINRVRNQWIIHDVNKKKSKQKKRVWMRCNARLINS